MNTLTNLHANLIQCRCRQILQGCWFRNRSLSVTVCLSGCLLLAAKQLQVFKVLHACHHTVYLHSVVWLLLQIPFFCVLFKVTKEARSNVWPELTPVSLKYMWLEIIPLLRFPSDIHCNDKDIVPLRMMQHRLNTYDWRHDITSHNKAARWWLAELSYYN